MRIGILTLPLHTNYGGILQAYALQTILEQMGHEVTLIDKGCPPKISFLGYTKRIVKGTIEKITGRTHTRWHQIYFLEDELRKEHKYTFLFVKKYIHRKVFPKLYNVKSNEFDCFVVGSDQIWRASYFYPIENAYLDFTKGWDVKRIAYAVSFGIDNWEYSIQQTTNCIKLVKEFDAIGVRENTGVSLCRNYLHCRAQHVLDPTLLLTPDNYIHQLNINSVEKSKGDFLVYILDMTDEKQRIVDFLTKQYDLKPFYVNSKCEDKRCKLEDRIQPPVESWLRGFYDAKLVFTDSFHACAFAINFNKPFFVFSNNSRGITRVKSLLNSFGLNDRLIDNVNIEDNKFLKTIDWTYVNNLLKKKRSESLKFLTDYIK